MTDRSFDVDPQENRISNRSHFLTRFKFPKRIVNLATWREVAEFTKAPQMTVALVPRSARTNENSYVLLIRTNDRIPVKTFEQRIRECPKLSGLYELSTELTVRGRYFNDSENFKYVEGGSIHIIYPRVANQAGSAPRQVARESVALDQAAPRAGQARPYSASARSKQMPPAKSPPPPAKRRCASRVGGGGEGGEGGLGAGGEVDEGGDGLGAGGEVDEGGDGGLGAGGEELELARQPVGGGGEEYLGGAGEVGGELARREPRHHAVRWSPEPSAPSPPHTPPPPPRQFARPVGGGGEGGLGGAGGAGGVPESMHMMSPGQRARLAIDEMEMSSEKKEADHKKKEALWSQEKQDLETRLKEAEEKTKKAKELGAALAAAAAASAAAAATSETAAAASAAAAAVLSAAAAALAEA